MASSKRPPHHDDHDRDGQAPGNESKRRQGDSIQTRIRTFRDMIKGQWMNDILEPIVRKVVREEVPPILERHLCPRGQGINETGTSGGRGRTLQLRFQGLPSEVFTRTKVVAKGGVPLEIALIQRDASFQNCIVRDGPLSSIRIELCVLQGDFGSNGSEDWTAGEFNANILCKTREGGQLLSGDRFIRLTNGVGYITQVFVTDISRWARTGQFRLGAKVAEPTPDVANIREGISEPFKVKDIRGETYKKHETPSLDDEIWRLRNIAKDGTRHQQLSSLGIVTVKDLLHWHNANPHLLKKTIGKIGKKSWEKLIHNANACARQDGANSYNYPTTEQPNARQPYLPIGSLDSEHKRLVERAEPCAYENLQHDFLTAHQGLCVPSTSTSQIGQAVHIGQPDSVSYAGGKYSPELLIDENIWANFLDFPSGDGGQSSYHSSYTNSAVYISSKGNGKSVWYKIRNAFKVAMLYMYQAKRKAKLVPHNL